MRNDEPPDSPSRSVKDHPAPLGGLTEIFDRRNIAVGIDSSGQVVLARPNTVLARVADDAERRSLADYVAKYDPKEAEQIRNDREPGLPFVSVRVPGVERELINNESRWTLGGVQSVISALASLDPPVESELNHVVFGEQVVKGNPLGAPATWAGEMAFLGNVIETKPDEHGVSHKVLLSTAEPAEAPRFLRRPLNISARRRPQILVLDTGLRTVVDERSGTRRPEHAILECCKVHTGWRDAQPGGSGQIPIDDEDEPDDDGTKSLDFEGGHGTFIAGIIAQLCPDAEVHIAGVLSSFGDGDVAGVVAGLQAGLSTADQPIDLVVMSLGAFLADDDPGVFGESVLQLLGDNVVGVAAAGNQGTCRPFFPAALPEVIGVGAVTAAGRAWFSNFGGWVDACAPGVDVVSTFLTFSEAADLFPDDSSFAPRDYRGWASWSGTSFSAPKVAAVLAQEMYLNLDADESDLITAREAWRRLTTHDHLRMPDLGVVFNA